MNTTPKSESQGWRQLDDTILVKAHLKGEPGAFEVLFKKHAATISRLVHSIVKDESLVDDIVQEVFLSVYRYLPKFRAESSFKTWVYRIAVNEAIRHYNKRKRWVTVPPDAMESVTPPPTFIPFQAGSSPEKLVLEGEQRETVQTALGSLKPNHQVILTLFYLEELPIQEVAEILEIPLGSVKSRLFYARENLKKILESPEKKQTIDQKRAHHDL